MLTVHPFFLTTIGAWTAALFFGLVVGTFLSWLLVREVWEAVDDEARAEWPNTTAGKRQVVPRYQWMGVLVGVTERLLYIPAFALGRPEFLLIWLTLKAVAVARRWTDDAIVPGRAIFNTFLVGNATSIAIALVSAGMIQWLVGPSWERDPALALIAPAALSGLLLVLWTGLCFWARPAIRNRKP